MDTKVGKKRNIAKMMNAQFETTPSLASGEAANESDYGGNGTSTSSNETSNTFIEESYFQVYGIEGWIVFALLGWTGAAVIALIIVSIVSVRRANNLSWKEKLAFSRSSFPPKPIVRKRSASAVAARVEEPYDHKKAIMSKYLTEYKAGGKKHTGETVINVIPDSSAGDTYDEQFNFDSVSQARGRSKMPEYSGSATDNKNSERKSRKDSKKLKRKKSDPHRPSDRKPHISFDMNDRRASHPVDSSPKTALKKKRKRKVYQDERPSDRERSGRGVSSKKEKVSEEGSQDTEEFDEDEYDTMSEITDDLTDVASDYDAGESVSIPPPPRKKAAKKVWKKEEEKGEKKDWKRTWQGLWPGKKPFDSPLKDEDITKPTAGKLGVIQYLREDLCSCLFQRRIYEDPRGWTETGEEDNDDNWNPMAEMVAKEQESYSAQVVAASAEPSFVDSSSVEGLSSTVERSTEATSEVPPPAAQTKKAKRGKKDEEDTDVTVFVKMAGASVAKEDSDEEEEGTVVSVATSADDSESGDISPSDVASDSETAIT